MHIKAIVYRHYLSLILINAPTAVTQNTDDDTVTDDIVSENWHKLWPIKAAQ